jgi:hypothetical protein
MHSLFPSLLRYSYAHPIHPSILLCQSQFLATTLGMQNDLRGRGCRSGPSIRSLSSLTSLFCHHSIIVLLLVVTGHTPLKIVMLANGNAVNLMLFNFTLRKINNKYMPKKRLPVSFLKLPYFFFDPTSITSILPYCF